MRHLGAAVRNGIVSVSEWVKRFRDLDAAMGTQLRQAGLSAREHTALFKVMNAATQEATRLEAVQRSGASAYKTDDLKRFAAALNDIQQARRAGIVSEKDALVQLKSHMSAMAQYSGTLKENSAEHQKLNAIMKATGEVTRQLEAQQDRLEAAFRADYLKLYAGELKNKSSAE